MHARRPRIGGILLLTILLVLTGLLPASPALAALEKELELADDLQQFGRGVNFQRTALTSFRDEAATSPADKAGGVQLIPVGVINNWRDSQESVLPVPRTDHAAAYLNGRIYVLGGSVLSPDTQTLIPTSTVLSAAGVLTDTVTDFQSSRNGTLQIPADSSNAWRTEASLPALPDGIDSDSDPEAAERTALGAVAVAKDSTTGYLYAVGGAYRGQGDDFSTQGVQIGNVAADGRITWRNGPIIPLGRDEGVQSAVVLKHKARDGNTYIYIIGGLTRTESGGSSIEIGSRAVYRARVNLTTGDLQKSDATAGWDKLGDIPIESDTEISAGLSIQDKARLGIWNSGATISRLPVNGQETDVLYLSGGQVLATPDRFTGKVFQAIVAANGDITWTNPQTYVAALTAAWADHTTAEYNGNVYLLGGTSIASNRPQTPQRSAQASYIEDDGKLNKLGDPTTGSEFARDNSVLSYPRYNHATVVVPIPNTANAYIYVIGGQGDSVQDPRGSARIFYGLAGGVTGDNVRYASNGWYVSEVVDITSLSKVNADNGKLKNLRWDTVLSGNLDTQIQYRYTTAQAMPETEPWLPVTSTQALENRAGFGSNTGVNSINLGDPVARLFQFRTRLVAPGGSKITPILQRIVLTVEFVGAPNLKFPDNPIVPIGTEDGRRVLQAVQITIANKDPDPNELPLRPADFDGSGSFFVDIYVERSPSSAPKFGDVGDAYAEVQKREMKIDGTYTIPKWCKPNPSGPCEELDLLDLFRQPGKYDVYVYVDSVWPDDLTKNNGRGNVTEARTADAGPEQDNLATLTTPIEIVTTLPAGCTATPAPVTCPFTAGTTTKVVRLPFIIRLNRG